MLTKPNPKLGLIEEEFLQFFIRLAQNLGLPKSLGEIYGLLFIARGELAFDEIVTTLQISKGSVSQGLRTLERMNAVEAIQPVGERKTFYRAELGVKRLLRGFIQGTVVPQLSNGDERIKKIEVMLKEEGGDAHLRSRLESLRTWNAKSRRLLPFLIRLFSKSQP